MTPAELFKLVKKTKYKTVGDSVEYCIMVLDGRPALLFQGSTTWRDYVNDFRFARKLYKNQESCMIVHHGVGDMWKSANDQIITEFAKLCFEHSCTTPIIAGWSLGGGLALLATEDLHYRTGITPDTFTFGALKVCGSRKTADYIRDCGNIIQYMQPNDIVPYLPPLWGFCHANRTIIGDRLSLAKIIHVKRYHMGYDKVAMYEMYE